MSQCEYPESFLRGIVQKEHISDFIIKSSFFSSGFSKNPREDGYFDMSINWYDCKESLDLAMNQRKENTEEKAITYKHGIAEFDTKIINDIVKRYKNLLSYERAPLDNNIYHGNLLLSDKLDKLERPTLFGVMSFAFVKVHDNRNVEKTSE